MIAVDTSALMAVLLREPEQDHMISLLERADGVVISAGTLVELRLVAYRRFGAPLAAEVDVSLGLFDVVIIPVDREQADIAHTAFTRFGKGTGHPAQLNYGDLFAYALAKSRNIPLLFKGTDFAATDVIAAA